VLSRRLRTTFFNRASGFVTTVALQKQLCAFAPAKATHSISIPSQLFASGLLPPALGRKSLQVALTREPFVLWVTKSNLQSV
jgi:hypothetical protein